MNICVYGAASHEIDSSYIEKVEKVGEELVKRGHKLVFGAGGNGLMGAAARGVHRQNGFIYGIVPEFFREENIEALFEECDELIYTDTMAERKTMMEDLADAFIVVPGGIGTFEELFQILTLKQLGRHTKPIVLFDINGYYKKMEDFLSISVSERFIRGACRELYYYTDDIDSAFSYVENDERKKQNIKDVKIG